LVAEEQRGMSKNEKERKKKKLIVLRTKEKDGAFNQRKYSILDLK
jgi:hypothetical protein